MPKEMNYGHGFDIIITSDGGYLMVGHTVSFGKGLCDFYVVKTDKDGYVEWSNSYGSGDDEAAKKVIETKDGGFAITGFWQDDHDVNCEVALLKIDKEGNELWFKRLPGVEFGLGNDLIENDKGVLVLAGGARRFLSGIEDMYVIWLSQDGHVFQEKYYGGKGEDRAYSIVADDNGGYVIGGHSKSYGDGSYDILLIKIDEQGEQIWKYVYGGIYEDRCYSICKTNDYGYMLTAFSGMNDYAQTNVLIIKVTEDGETAWVKTFGGDKADFSYEIQQTADNGFIAVGKTSSFGQGGSDVYLIKIDDNGNTTGFEDLPGRQTVTMTVYPNPIDISAKLYSDLPIRLYNGRITIEIVDINGRVVRVIENVKSSSIDIHKRELPPGIYIVSMKMEERTVSSCKFIIR